MTSIIGVHPTNPLLCRHPNISLNLPLIEGSGDTVYDLSGNDNNGAIINAEWTSTEHGWALDFNGIDTYVDCGTGSTLAITNEITVEAIIKAETVPTDKWPGVVGKYRHSNKYSFLLHLNPDQTAAFVAGNGTTVRTPVNSISEIAGTGEWCHLVGVCDENVVYIYVNGVQTNQKTISFTLGTNDLSVNIGRWGGDYGDILNGMLIFARIYNHALSAAEVKYSYLDIKRRLRI
ncbi:MAG: LamG domain-containing protein [Halobacteriota archaeon]|nr:LamG domain-containing protein [Halobacteriota archaeon]